MGTHRVYVRSVWTDEKDSRLAALWTGGKTAAEIAALLSSSSGVLTRNAVIGRIHRMRLDRPGLLTGAKPLRKRLPKPQNAVAYHERMRQANSLKGRAKAQQKMRPQPSAADVASLGEERFAEGYLGQTGRVGLLELMPDMCRFPVDRKFCGDSAEAGTSWCPHHAARVFRSAEMTVRP